MSACCLHRAQTVLSSKQYFCKNFLFLTLKSILNINTIKHISTPVDNLILRGITSKRQLIRLCGELDRDSGMFCICWQRFELSGCFLVCIMLYLYVAIL